MSNYKTLHGVQLQPCCIKTVKIINGRIKRANTLQIAMPACIFVQMFLGPSKSEISTLYSVSSTDWGLLAEAIRSINTIVKRAVLNDAAGEMVNHPSGQLGDFWTGIYEAFEG
jgi:hypothetical protein